MITEAALYLAAEEDATCALARVAGRPAVFRMVMAAARAGCHRIWVPAALRHPALERLVTSTPSARAAVAWLGAGIPAPRGPLLLVPAAGVATTPALAAVTAGAPETAPALGLNTVAPVLAVSAGLTSALWPRIAEARPIADDVARVLERRQTGDESDAGWYLRVASEPAAREAERRLYAALGSPIDTRLDRLVHRRLSRPVTRVALACGVTPNQVTLASLVVGLAAAWSFWAATPAGALGGLLLYLAAVVLDHVDGEVARLTLRESRVGEWLDITNDTVIHAVLVLALGLTAEHVTGSGLWSGAVAAAGVIGSAAVTKTGQASAHHPIGRLLNGLGNRDGYYAMLLLFILGLAAWPAALPALMVVVALGSHGFWLASLLHRLTGARYCW